MIVTSKTPPYIVPIFIPGDGCDKFNGTGFVVGNYLITAAHVVSSNMGFGVYAQIGQANIRLGFNFVQLKNDGGRIDLAVFSIPQNLVDSPLSLADEEPICDIEQGFTMTSKHFLPQEDGGFMYRECGCVVYRQNPDSNYCFDGYNEIETFAGSSGSPLVKDNVVYGMLVDGHESDKATFSIKEEDKHLLTHIVTFLKASEIKKRLDAAGIK